MKRTALARTTPLRPRRPGKRRVAVLRDPQYRKWLRNECLCLACLKAFREDMSFAFTSIEACHTKLNGAGSKGPDSSCVPLCAWHHRFQHKLGMPDFEAKYKLDMQAEAARHYAAYLAGETIR